jgi:hypothetical protein
LWTTEGIGRRRHNSPVKETWATEKRTRQYGTKNQEGMFMQVETLEGPSKQNWNKVPRRQRATKPEKGEDNLDEYFNLDFFG